ncbi:uncharacterized protein LOC131685095 [Topomyia yanbarensis]|uniref:uncharacterized protein LOC131685095 n=1 Tax=Topomyia yanbarensis TaxID=2498891 RepID=UPI00273C8AA4|nr:uncharacterized protein LOC131685095 [Topomyia yanbarensis]
MKFLWLLAFLLALVGVVLGQDCPAGFDRKDNKCTVDRPVHGNCPDNTAYSVALNKCVLK